jgi:hypothetical protein
VSPSERWNFISHRLSWQTNFDGFSALDRRTRKKKSFLASKKSQ